MTLFTVHLKDGTDKVVEASYFRAVKDGLAFFGDGEDEVERLICSYDKVSWSSFAREGKRLRIRRASH